MPSFVDSPSESSHWEEGVEDRLRGGERRKGENLLGMQNEIKKEIKKRGKD